MAGLGVGAEMGANIGDLYFIGGYQATLAGATVPYGNNVDANVGYVYENVLFDLGFSWVDRRVALQGKDSGLTRGYLADTQLILKLGAGVAF